MAEDIVSSTHPLLPPTSEDDRLARLRLLRSRRVGISTYYRLLCEHGSAQAALEALPEIARRAGLSAYAPCSWEIAVAELRDGQRLGARLVFQGEDAYPVDLLDLDDAPPFLWMRGALDILTRPRIAVVGARNASSLGTRMARSLAQDLGEAGFVVVSGLARGIDAAAHTAALETGTIAVFGGGVDVIYPLENTELAQRIEQHGLIVSENAIGLSPTARHFPARNRLISGMSRAMVVVEAAERSGSLTAARHAADQGREILAVPGHPLEPRAAGSNGLLRDGATLIRNVDDILEAMSPLAPRNRAPAQIQMPFEPAAQKAETNLREAAALHTQILARLDPAPMSEDRLIRALDAPTHIVSEQLSDLELTGQIERQTGGLVRRVR